VVYTNRQYNDEVILLDGLYEFHRGVFDSLDIADFDALKTFYGLGNSKIEDIQRHRLEVARLDPDLETRARGAYEKVCSIFRISK